MAILFVVILLTACCARQAISRCIVLVQQGSLAIGSAPSLAFMPLVISALQMGLVIFVVMSLMVLTTLDSSGTKGQCAR